MAKNPSKSKAAEMLHNPPHGKPLTEKQRKYFGAIANAQKGKKVTIDGKEYDTSSLEYEDLYKKGIGYFDKKDNFISSHTTLPEVVISKKDKDTKAFYENLQPSDQYAFDQMTKQYGPVNIKYDKGTGVFSKTKGHYNPFTNSIVINTDTNADPVTVYLSELSHKAQFDKRGKLNVIGDWIFNDLPTYIKGKSPYNDPSTMEYEAHSKYQPKLLNEFVDYEYNDLLGEYPQKKNGGWLDKYDDGGNANDGHSSGEANWMGEGYTTKGFDYNSAWGGQFQTGGDIGTRPEDQGIREMDAWEKAYTNSPRFTQLSQKQGDTPEMTQKRRDVINNFNVDRDVVRMPEGVSYVDINEKNIPTFYLSPTTPEEVPFDIVNAHELGHLPYNNAELSFPKGTYDQIQSKNFEFQKMKKTGKTNENVEHDVNPNEVRADKQGLLQELRQMGIYDATKDGDITPEQWKKYKESGKWHRLQRLYNDKDIQWLINNVAQNTPNNIANTTAAMGASIPGSVGFTYARTGSTPSEGPYAKKTLPSAENGMTFYQHGLDWTPRNISKNGGWLDKYAEGGEKGPGDPPVGAAEKQFIINWNNSPMANQMLEASVDKDDPVGRNYIFVEDIKDARNKLTNKAKIELLPQNQIADKYEEVYGHNPGTGTKGFSRTELTNKAKDLANGLLNSITTPALINDGAYYTVDARNFNNIEPKLYTDTSNVDSISGINLHELSHASDLNGKLIPISDIKKMNTFAHGLPGAPNTVLNDDQNYIAKATETRARLMNFRFNANNQKLYDPFNQKVSIDVLKNYKGSNDGLDPLEQLRLLYSDGEIIDMLNSISMNESNGQQNIAKWGTKIETAQKGKYILPRYDMPRAASESTSRVFNGPNGPVNTATVGQKNKDLKATMEAMGKAKQKEKSNEKQRIAERKAAVAAKDKGTTFTLPTGETKKYEDMDAREKMYVSGKALEQRGRFNENEESFFDEWINPLSFIGGMAGDLATAPYVAKQTNSNLPYIGAIANPLIMGALGMDPLGSTINVGKKIGNKVGQSMESGLLSKTPKFISSEPVITRGPINWYDMPGFKERNPGITDWSKYMGDIKIGKPTAAMDESLMPFIEGQSSFKSEIDWGKWNSEIPSNKALVDEYHTIEQTSKANDSWMKNPDGSKFQGTPEQFVQQNSENFKKAFPEGFTEGYRGAHQHISDFKNRDRNDYATFLTDSKANAESYATSDDLPKTYYHPNINKSDEWTDGIYQLGFPQNLPKVVGEAEGRNWRFLNYDKKIADGIPPEYIKDSHEFRQSMFNSDMKNSLDYPKDYNPLNRNYLTTDNYASYVKRNPEAIAEIRNVKDQMGYSNKIPSSTVYAIDANRVPLKSLRYNNGMFDMTNPNIYKALFPAAIGAGVLQQKKQGGVVKDNEGYWNPNNWGKTVEIGSPDITMQGVNQPLLGISDEGDVQYMEPGKDYKFKGKKVTEYPIAQNGIATRSDSTFLLKNNKIIDKFLNSGNYRWSTSGKRKINPKSWKSDFKNLTDFYERVIPSEINKGVYNGKNKGTLKDYRNKIGKFIGTSDWISGGGDDYGFPFQYIHPDIAPQYHGDLWSDDISKYPFVGSYRYDDLAITPWDMLSPEQQKERVKKYGTSGTPYNDERKIAQQQLVKNAESKSKYIPESKYTPNKIQTTPGQTQIIDNSREKVELPPVQNLPYRVDYTDNSGKKASAFFSSDKEGAEFMKQHNKDMMENRQVPAEMQGYYENPPKKKNGGWLDKYN